MIKLDEISGLGRTQGRGAPKLGSSAIFGKHAQAVRFGYSLASAELRRNGHKLVGASKTAISRAVKATLHRAVEQAEDIAVLRWEPTRRPIAEIKHEAIYTKDSFRAVGSSGRIYAVGESERIRSRRGQSRQFLKDKIIAELVFCSRPSPVSKLRRMLIGRLTYLDNTELSSRWALDSKRFQKIVTQGTEYERRRLLLEHLGAEVVDFRKLREASFVSGSHSATDVEILSYALLEYLDGREVDGIRVLREALVEGPIRISSVAREALEIVLARTTFLKGEDFIQCPPAKQEVDLTSSPLLIPTQLSPPTE